MVDYRPSRPSRSARKHTKRYVTGRDALKLIDGSVSRARKALDEAIRDAEETRQRRNEVRREQVSGFQALAKFRLDNLDEYDNEAGLTDAEQKASELLDQHAAYIEAEFAALDELQDRITGLEGDRDAASEKLEKAVADQTDKIESVLADLAGTEDWQRLKTALDEAGAVVERATQKLEIAEADRSEKGDPYESDPLFSYLWARKYRTTEYKAGGLTRMLDQWVGKLCGYDKAHLTYARLIELPERLSEHVERVTSLETEAEAALKALESDALSAAGIDAMEAEIEQTRQSIRDLDKAVEAAEAEHIERAKAHADAVEAKTGPAEEARVVLAAALRKMSFPDLRIMVSQTTDLEDDRIVDQLVRLRAEEMQLEISIKDEHRLPDDRRDALKSVEQMRAMFKRADFASQSVRMDRSVLEDALDDVRSGHRDVESALKRIRKTMRRSEDDDWGGGGRYHKRYQSRRRRHRYGGWDTPYGGIAQDVGTVVVWELAKAALRGGGSVMDVDIGDIDLGDMDDWTTGGGF